MHHLFKDDIITMDLELNKKVLLRKRKRHTVRRVASPGGTYLGYRGGGGHLPWPGGTHLGWEVPIVARMVYPRGVNRQTPAKTVPSPIIRMRVVII